MNNPDFYLRITRFNDDTEALSAYVTAQTIVFEEDVDLSVFRIRYNDVPFVVVLGIRPDDHVLDLFAFLTEAPVDSLPIEVIRSLAARREDASAIGPWVEGHYRPGLRTHTEESDT